MRIRVFLMRGVFWCGAAVICRFCPALPFLLPASALDQPAPFYPIGTSNGTNANVSSRLFEIDGTVGYFAGFGYKSRLLLLLKLSQETTRGGWHI
jgi:hypothetical protein